MVPFPSYWSSIEVLLLEVHRYWVPFLFTGVAVKKSDISDISSSLDFSKTFSLGCLTEAESHSQSSHLELLSRSCLKIRGGNDDRNGIYSSPTEVISDAISFVNPLHDALAKKCARESHEMAKTVLKIAHLMAMMYISMKPTPSMEKVSSYGLLPRFVYMASGRG